MSDSSVQTIVFAHLKCKDIYSCIINEISSGNLEYDDLRKVKLHFELNNLDFDLDQFLKQLEKELDILIEALKLGLQKKLKERGRTVGGEKIGWHTIWSYIDSFITNNGNLKTGNEKYLFPKIFGREAGDIPSGMFYFYGPNSFKDIRKEYLGSKEDSKKLLKDFKKWKRDRMKTKEDCLLDFYNIITQSNVTSTQDIPIEVLYFLNKHFTHNHLARPLLEKQYLKDREPELDGHFIKNMKQLFKTESSNTLKYGYAKKFGITDSVARKIIDNLRERHSVF